MASTLRDDLASLKIERRNSVREEKAPRARDYSGGGGGLKLVSFLLWMIPLGVLVGGGVIGYQQYEKIKPRAVVNVGLVQAMTTGEAETLLSAKGYIKSVSQAMIGAKIPGRVSKLLVKEGDKVHGPTATEPGQVLAILEHEDLKAQKASREAMLERTIAEIEEAETDFKLKEAKYKRRAQLQSRGTVTGEEIEQYYSDWRMADNKVAALRAAVKVQQAMVHEIDTQIQDMFIRAPFDGTVTEKGAEVGETILLGGMGAASGRGSVATLADLSNLEVETDIAENLLARVAVGQPAEIAVSAVPGVHYRGRLERVIPMGDRSRGTVKVRVKILDPDEHLFPELVSTVHFLPDKAVENPNTGKTFLFVPKAAVFEADGHQYVWTVDSKSRVHQKQVEAVVTNDDLARIEKGLQAGEKVVLNPEKGLKDGQTVALDD